MLQLEGKLFGKPQSINQCVVDNMEKLDYIFATKHKRLKYQHSLKGYREAKHEGNKRN